MKRPLSFSSFPGTSVSGSPPRIISKVLAAGGLFHCTSVPALRRILWDGHLRPALATGAPARGAGVASLCRRLSGVCVFDVLPKMEVVRLQMPDPGWAWLGSWLKIAKPVTAVIHLDKARVRAHGGPLLSCAEARVFGSGVMLPGELCYRGAIPLDTCVLGFLFVRWAGRTALIGEYVAGHTLTKINLQDVLARLDARASRRTPN